MSKNKAEELNAIKEDVEILNKKLAELTAEELEQVSGGVDFLETIKEKKILAATDTITAADRKSLQTEIERLSRQIDENTY